MIEIISVPIQTVAVGQNVLFSQTAVKAAVRNDTEEEADR